MPRGAHPARAPGSTPSLSRAVGSGALFRRSCGQLNSARLIASATAANSSFFDDFVNWTAFGSF